MRRCVAAAAGPPLSRPPLQPLNRDPFPPPPVSEEALLPDDAEIRLVREDKSHEVRGLLSWKFRFPTSRCWLLPPGLDCCLQAFSLANM